MLRLMECHQYKTREKLRKESTVREGLYYEDLVLRFPLKSTTVSSISIKDATPYILKYEYLGTMPGWSRYAFGHYWGSEIGGVVVLGDTTGSDVAFTRLFPGKKGIQLQRGVNFWWTPKNSASYFISRVCRWLRENTNYNFITATADSEAGEAGVIYKALNWDDMGIKKHGHPVFFIDGKKVHPKTLYDRHGTSGVGKIRVIYGDRVRIEERVFKRRFLYFLK